MMIFACQPLRESPAAQVQLPRMHLAPSALGRELSVQQRLNFEFSGQQRQLDALLQVDSTQLDLLVQAMGQSGVRLSWDGLELQQQRAAWLPPSVRGERVLDDLQFSLWPLHAIRAVLPLGWSVREEGNTRQLLQGQKMWLEVETTSPRHMRLRNLAEGYRLDIESAEAESRP